MRSVDAMVKLIRHQLDVRQRAANMDWQCHVTTFDLRKTGIQSTIDKGYAVGSKPASRVAGTRRLTSAASPKLWQEIR